MPNQITKFLEKAKSKISTGFCGSQDHLMNQSTYISITKVNVVTPVKINPQQKTLKKSVARANLFNDKSNDVCDQSSVNISQFPLLISTPERNRTLDSITQFDSTGSEIFESTTSDYGSNVSSAYSNVLYESPQCRQNTTPFSQMTIESFGFGSKDFCSANSLLFEHDQSLPESSQEHEQEQDKEIFVCRVSYTAKTANELSIKFSDRLLVLNKDSNLCYVKNVLTNQCGLVPNSTICKLSQFLSDIKQIISN